MSFIKTLQFSEDKRLVAVVEAWTRGFDYSSYSNICQKLETKTLTPTMYDNICEVLTEEMDIHMFGGNG